MTQEPIAIKNLADEFELEPRIVRRILRTAGLRAPEEDGKRKAYSFEPKSPELTKARKALREYKAKDQAT